MENKAQVILFGWGEIFTRVRVDGTVEWKIETPPTDEEIQLKAIEYEAHIEQIKNDKLAQEEYEQDKADKEEALRNIVVTTSNGNAFDGHESARLNMSNAIQASTILGLTSSNWKLADNTVKEISINELQEALALSIQAVGSIIVGE